MGKDASGGVMSVRATVEARDVVCCQVAAYGALQAGAAMIASWRRQPPVPPGWSLPANFLKNSDPQTIAGLAALYRAIDQHRLELPNRQEWGVIAAPCLLGRSALALACQRFAVEGAWAISPNLIPHHSLHALSGTISQALNLHGPNFGVGGGPGAAAEGFIMAATLLANLSLPGLWLVLTAFEPELMPVDPSLPADTTPAGPEPLCDAVALALVPSTTQGSIPSAGEGAALPPRRRSGSDQLIISQLLTLRIASAGAEPFSLGPGQNQESCSRFRLPLLRAALSSPTARPNCRWQLETGGWIELKDEG